MSLLEPRLVEGALEILVRSEDGRSRVHLETGVARRKGRLSVLREARLDLKFKVYHSLSELANFEGSRMSAKMDGGGGRRGKQEEGAQSFQLFG